VPFDNVIAMVLIGVVGVLWLLSKADTILAWYLQGGEAPRVPEVAAPTAPAPAVPNRPDA
jgi:hypothetical protein